MPFGYYALRSLQRRLDPFLILDAFHSDQLGDYIGGFSDHPHRGFKAITYMIAGRRVIHAAVEFHVAEGVASGRGAHQSVDPRLRASFDVHGW